MRRSLTCIGISKGIIGLINEEGNVEHYCLRGLKKLTLAEQTCAIESGIIVPHAFNLKELPSNISLVFEHPGMRARVSFDKKWLYG